MDGPYSAAYKNSNSDLDSGYSASRDRLDLARRPLRKLRIRGSSDGEQYPAMEPHHAARRYSETDFSRYRSGPRLSICSDGFFDDDSRTSHQFRHSVDDLIFENDGNYSVRERSDTFPKDFRRTKTKSTQTPPLDLVLLEMRMERDMRAESGDNNWMSVYEKSGDPDWRQLGREMRYLADDWREYTQEIESSGDAIPEKSIWRSILETVLYVKNSTIIPSFRRRSKSMSNLSNDFQKRKNQFLVNKSSMDLKKSSDTDSTGYSSEENIFSYQQQHPKKHFIKNQKKAPKILLSHKGTSFMENEDSNIYRRRSQSFTFSREISKIEECDLDLHIMTPFSEQFEEKHYQKLNSNPDMNRLKIATSSDDEDVTPEVKFIGMTSNDNMFKMND